MAISNGNIGVHKNKDSQESAVLHRDLHHEFLEVVRGEGNYLFLKDGRKVFDASGGAAVACIGVSLPLSASSVLKWQSSNTILAPGAWINVG